ncbi:MAG: Maf family nucleotide pyrophosphatase [Bacteroidota bacterium]
MIENPLLQKLKDKRLVLGSGSPRRRKFLEELGLLFEVRLKPVEEEYPETLLGAEIADYLAKLKADALKDTLAEDELLITSDTVVWCKGHSLAKAKDAHDAKTMLEQLSGGWHEVITAVCFTSLKQQQTVHSTTEVKIKKLKTTEIDFYIAQCQPFDKAGAYGIQEWFGAIAIEAIKGSYNNVVGLPTHLIYEVLEQW